MSRIHGSPSGSDFVRSLVEAGRDERPPAGTAARMLAHAAAAPVAVASAPAIATKGVWIASALSALAAAAGVAVVAHRGAPAGPVPTEALAAPSATAPPASSEKPLSTPPPRTAFYPSSSASAVVGRSLCDRVSLPDRAPTQCSLPGRKESIEIVNTCATEMDLYWVDYKCRETFVARLAPGQTLDHSTMDTHPWRVRDHATHRLVKEWVGPGQSEPPKEPVHLPDVEIHDGDTAADRPPSVCSRPGNPATLRFDNKRTSGVSIAFWVDYECHERVYRRMEPGEVWEQQTSDTHPWRVRDENGALLVEFRPDGVDQTVYISLP